MTTALALALLTAGAYGASDFIGGLVSRRTSAWRVAIVAQLASGASILAVAGFIGGSPQGGDLAWAALGGVGTGVGVGFLFRGMARGAMSVVAPLSAVGSALVPVLAGIGIGERPGPLALAAIALALPAIWLVAAEPRPAPSSAAPSGSEQPPAPTAPTWGARVPDGVGDGMVAGIGFGAAFTAFSRLGDDAGLWPLGMGQLVAASVCVVLASVLNQPWRPDRTSLRAVPAGPLGAVALTSFVLAQRDGLLSVTAVVASLYPAVTVLLAMLLLSERLRRAQVGGMALCLGVVVLMGIA